MNKSELITKICEKTNLQKTDAGKFLDAFMESVREALAAGDEVLLVKFLRIYVATRKARKGKNPKTGDVIDIKEARVVKIKPGISLMSALDEE